MILIKDNVTIDVIGENHINAFISAGYKPAEESRVDADHDKSTVDKKKSAKSKTSEK